MATPSGPAFRALIIEDHAFQRSIAAQILGNCGANEVLEAGDGASALAKIGQDPRIDLLLCDLNMPGMDGLAFLRHIAEQQVCCSVILVSALEPAILKTAEVMAKSYGLRILGIVEKPLSLAKLMPLVLRHFSQNAVAARPPPPVSADDVAAGLERGEFVPYFQPKVDLKSGALAGVEALLRWRHPRHGHVPPTTFVPVMETNGLVTAATFGLVETVLAQCRDWQRAGLDIPVAVNISVESLSDTALADRLEALVHAAGLTPKALCLEVTETVAMTDLGHALETLARCRMKGFGLSIDDYGTGFSSMQQLTRLPVGEIKIDQGFVTGAAGAPVLAALIETTVAMARRLRLKTVAEGVETAEDWTLVSQLGCDVAQGFFIARPMPGEAIPDWHTTWRAAYSPPPASQAAPRR